jgi:hypothetical protein
MATAAIIELVADEDRFSSRGGIGHAATTFVASSSLLPVGGVDRIR